MKYSVDISVSDKDRNEAVMKAVSKGHWDAVEILLERSANVKPH